MAAARKAGTCRFGIRFGAPLCFRRGRRPVAGIGKFRASIAGISLAVRCRKGTPRSRFRPQVARFRAEDLPISTIASPKSGTGRHSRVAAVGSAECASRPDAASAERAARHPAAVSLSHAACCALVCCAATCVAHEPAPPPPRSVAAVMGPRVADDPAMAERAAVLRSAEAALARGEPTQAVNAFDRAALMLHSADAEMSLVRAYLQAGEYRRALAFCAPTGPGRTSSLRWRARSARRCCAWAIRCSTRCGAGSSHRGRSPAAPCSNRRTGRLRTACPLRRRLRGSCRAPPRDPYAGSPGFAVEYAWSVSASGARS